MRSAARSDSGPPRRLMLAVALVASATLVEEILVTRLSSVLFYYHFSFFSIALVMSGLVIGGLIVLAIGDNPLKVYLLLITSAFGLFDALGNFTFDNWGYTLFQTTPLIFTIPNNVASLRCVRPPAIQALTHSGSARHSARYSITAS